MRMRSVVASPGFVVGGRARAVSRRTRGGRRLGHARYQCEGDRKNTVSDTSGQACNDVAFATVAGVLVYDNVGRAPLLRERLAGTAPGKGEAYMCLPSDAYSFSQNESRLLIRAREARESQQESREGAVRRWDVKLGAHFAGAANLETSKFDWGAPAPWSLREALGNVPRAHCGATFSELDLRSGGR